jgi:hypothetical protein
LAGETSARLRVQQHVHAIGIATHAPAGFSPRYGGGAAWGHGRRRVSAFRILNATRT